MSDLEEEEMQMKVERVRGPWPSPSRQPMEERGERLIAIAAVGEGQGLICTSVS
jgi:hypothetical protein